MNHDDFSSSSSSEDEDYIETEPPFQFKIQCLFCSDQNSSSSYEEFFEKHLPVKHKIENFIEKCKTSGLDTFQFIKLINFIRTNNVPEENFEKIVKTKPFDDDNYLKPALEDDQLLMFDYESEIEDDEMIVQASGDDNAIRNSLARLSPQKLIDQIMVLRSCHAEAEKTIESLRNLLCDDGDLEMKKLTVTSLDEQSDADYISSYNNANIHHQMLSDIPRTEAYERAILENQSMFQDKTVLDIGCGLGILSLFAAKAGARLVVAIDHSDIIFQAKEIIKENGMEHRIKTIKGKLERIDFEALGLPTRYDIIVSEWMGYFLLFEGMVDTILYAREKFLVPRTGLLLPNRCKLFLAALSDATLHEEYVDFWNNVYGFRMTTMIPLVVSQTIIDTVKPESICSSTEKICDLNLDHCTEKSVMEIRSPLELRFPHKTIIHGFIGWFQCQFEGLPKPVMLSTSPFDQPTHWCQTIFPLSEPLPIEPDMTVTGEVIIRRDSNNPRYLQIEFYLKKPKEINLFYSV